MVTIQGEFQLEVQVVKCIIAQQHTHNNMCSTMQSKVSDSIQVKYLALQRSV